MFDSNKIPTRAEKEEIELNKKISYVISDIEDFLLPLVREEYPVEIRLGCKRSEGEDFYKKVVSAFDELHKDRLGITFKFDKIEPYSKYVVFTVSLKK